MEPENPKAEIVPRPPAGPPALRADSEPPSEPGALETGEAGLLEYWRLLGRRKVVLALGVLLGAAAAVLYTLPQTPVYQAQATLEIQAVNPEFLNLRNVSPTVEEGNRYSPEYEIQTQVKVLGSRSLLGRVGKKLNAAAGPVPEPGRLALWARTLGLARPAAGREAAVESAADSLKIRGEPNTRLINVSCESASAQLAADFVNTLAAEFVDQNLEARWKTSQYVSEWLNRQTEALKIRLEQSEEALTAYARSTGLLITGEKDNLVEAKLRQVQEELSRAQGDRIARQSRLDLAATASPETLAEVLDSLALKEVQLRLTDLQRQYAELRASLTDEHPRVERVQAQINIVEAALARERNNILRRIRNDFDGAAEREKLLEAQYTRLLELVSDQGDKIAHYNILKREAEINRQLYQNILQRVKEAGVSSALRASNVRVVDPAEAPKVPARPDLRLNLALGMMLGGLAGVGFILYRERADTTLHLPGESGQLLNTFELGVIPSAAVPVPLPRLRRAPKEHEVALVSYDRAPSILAESFRAVLTSILFCGDHGGSPRVLVLASANPREGKTTAASNLAIVLAQIGRRVLLIDGDLRRPRLHDLFSLQNAEGLSTLLLCPVAVPGAPFAFDGAVQLTAVPNLFVLPSGPSSTAISSAVYSSRLPQLIRAAREQYEFVLIDTPPMLHMPDARVIGRHADGVILVLRASQTTRDAARRAHQRFRDDGTRVFGTILNDWNPRDSGYSRYYDGYKPEEYQ